MEIEQAKGISLEEAARKVGVTPPTIARWKSEFGGLRVDQAKHGLPEHIRSDNGPEFVARKLRQWLKQLEVKPLFIEKGSQWENGYCESFNGKMRDQLLNGELFYTLREAQIIIEKWRIHYNTIRPHSSLGGLPPAPVTIQLAS